MSLRSIGERASDAVVQLYLAPAEGTMAPPMARPAQGLVAFSKVHLDANVSTTLQMTLPARAFACFDPEIGDWQIRPGAYELRAAASSKAVELRAWLDYR